jgi:PKD domain
MAEMAAVALIELVGVLGGGYPDPFESRREFSLERPQVFGESTFRSERVLVDSVTGRLNYDQIFGLPVPTIDSHLAPPSSRLSILGEFMPQLVGVIVHLRRSGFRLPADRSEPAWATRALAQHARTAAKAPRSYQLYFFCEISTNGPGNSAFMTKERASLAILAAGLAVSACTGTFYAASGAGVNTGSGGSGSGSSSGSGSGSGSGGSASGGSGSGSGGSASGSGGSTASGGSAGSGICMNGTVDRGEACDGSNLVNATCASLGFTGGTLACSSSCQFDVSGCTGGAITPTIVASRTSCAAPCSVFFDATTTTGLAGGAGGSGGIAGGDYVQANWTWDFNDPTSPHKATIGFVAAHVFDNPGTYHVATRVQDLAGNAGTKTTTITVSAMSGTVYYVASSGKNGAVSGNDSNNGTSMTTPFLTLAHALTVAGTNKSILLRRGDTFNTGSSDITLAVTGPFLIGSYSDPGGPSTTNPILSSTDTSSSGSVYSLSGGSDMRFTDIHVVGGGAFSIFSMGAAPTSLFERVEIEGYTQGGGNGWYVATNVANVAVVDSHAHNYDGYGVYADRSQNLAIIGTQFDTFTGDDHVFRLQGGSSGQAGVSTSTLGQFTNNSYVAENTAIVPMANTTAAGGLFRGENTNSVYVNNTVNRVVAWLPQNTMVTEHVSLGLAEGNTIYRSDYNSGESCFNIIAQHIVLRNNLCPNADLFMKIDGNPTMPANWTDQIYVYNNTYYLGQSPSYPNQIAQIGGQQITTGTMTFRNNIEWTASSSNQSSIYSLNGGATVVTDHNDLYAPNGGTLGSPNVGTGGILTNPNFVSTTVGAAGAFTLSNGSPAVDTGTNTHVYQSFGNAPGRPQNAAWDMGAFELKNP